VSARINFDQAEAQNDIVSFQPSQWFFVAGSSGAGAAGVMVNSATYCAISSKGIEAITGPGGVVEPTV